MHPKYLFEFTYGGKNELKDLRVGHHVMTSLYPVHIFTYGGIYSPLKHFFLAYIKFYHATSHMVLANQKQDFGSM